ncbi:MAG: ACT domain-containing protein, partial [Thermaurantiacus tibetensis]
REFVGTVFRAQVLARQGANIVNLTLDERDRAHHHYVLDVEVEDARHLEDIVTGLKALEAVVAAERAPPA